MKTFVLALALLAPDVPAQTAPSVLHVTAVRDSLPTDAHCPVKCYVISGTVGDVHYTARQLFMWGSQHFQVGADYPVTVKGESLNVKMTDKKGHDVPERLNVVSAEEAK
jgi:hypothetical protein